MCSFDRPARPPAWTALLLQCVFLCLHDRRSPSHSTGVFQRLQEHVTKASPYIVQWNQCVCVCVRPAQGFLCDLWPSWAAMETILYVREQQLHMYKDQQHVLLYQKICSEKTIQKLYCVLFFLPGHSLRLSCAPKLPMCLIRCIMTSLSSRWLSRMWRRRTLCSSSSGPSSSPRTCQRNSSRRSPRDSSSCR